MISAATALLVKGLRAAAIASNANPTAVGVGTNLLMNTKVTRALIPSADTWWILNTETNEYVYGQYTTEVQHAVGSSYGEHFALNRQTPVTQFLHGNTETLTFDGRFFASFAFQEIVKQVRTLQSWTRRDSTLGRPPVCYFWIGDQYANMQSCFIQTANANFDKPTKIGQARGATVSIALRAYTPFSLNATASFDTRYHLVKLGESYELLAAREYKNPMLGVELRQRHRHQRVLAPGMVVKLPAPTGSIRRAKIEPKSIALAGITARRSTPQLEALRSKLGTRSSITSLIYGV